MLCESVKLLVRTGASENLSIPRGNHAPALTFESAGHDRGPTVPCAGVHSLVHKFDELIR